MSKILILLTSLQNLNLHKRGLGPDPWTLDQTLCRLQDKKMTKCRFDIRELVLEKYPKRYRFSFSKTKDFFVCKKVKFVRFELKILFQDFLCKVPVDKQFELKCDPCGGIRHLLLWAQHQKQHRSHRSHSWGDQQRSGLKVQTVTSHDVDELLEGDLIAKGQLTMSFHNLDYHQSCQARPTLSATVCPENELQGD